MDYEDSDDLYDPEESTPVTGQIKQEARNGELKMEDVEEGEEEGEELEDEDSDDDDINFITEAKEESKPDSISQGKRQASTAQSLAETRKVSSTPVPALKSEVKIDPKATPPSSNERRGTDYPAHHTSTIDPNGNPIHPTTGKPILSTDFDNDFPTESSKPWRKPGSDITDYFNYGFDEFTWASYCLKQQQMPKEIAEIKGQAEMMKAFVEGIPGGAPPGIPGMPGPPTGPAAGGAASGAMPAMPGMPSEAEMQQMFTSMMASGLDLNDPNQFMQMMMSGGAGGQGFGNQGQGFVTGQVAGQQQQMGFGGAGAGAGYDQGGNYGGGGRGRGRGGRRNWG